MAGLPDTGVSALDFSSPWQRLLVGTNTALNVFNVSADDWSMSSAQTVISVPAGAAVLVNVHGGPVTITYASIELLGADCRRTVFNYADAGQVTTTGFLHPGSVLAPYASASLSGGGVHGSALFGGNVATSLGFAFHNFPYCGQELPGPGQQDDSDGDGLPDTWELLFFGGFGRDGSGDFDGDGHTDAEEFAAGTDPADPASFPAPQTVSLEVRSAHGQWLVAQSHVTAESVWSVTANSRFEPAGGTLPVPAQPVQTYREAPSVTGERVLRQAAVAPIGYV